MVPVKLYPEGQNEQYHIICVWGWEIQAKGGARWHHLFF